MLVQKISLLLYQTMHLHVLLPKELFLHVISTYFAHHVNLVSTDICKTLFAKDVILKCQKIVRFFKQSHQAGEELRSKILNEIKGGGVKTYVVTRWSTAWDCTNSILRLEQVFKTVREDVFFIIYYIYFHLLIFP